MPYYPNGFIYEINIYILLNRLSKELKRKIPLRNVPVKFWRDLKQQGFNYIWLMGIWRRSPASRKVSLNDESLKDEYSRILKDWTREDIPGSPYAVCAYEPDERFGTFDDLMALKKKINALGLKLILDFVPNHTALDHPWSKEYPQRYICGDLNSVENYGREEFYKVDNKTFVAHGKDPNFPSWKDTIQLNYASQETRNVLINTLLQIAPYCDGLRCDMAMLVTNRIFQQTWSHLLKNHTMPAEEFWVTAINAIKAKFPDFVFIAEAYWDLEWELQQMGFDYTYDKRLYDRLLHSSADDVRGHLLADAEYQKKLLRFIENHDEPRILSQVPLEQAQAAGVILATIQGAKLIFDGQIEGKKIRIPVHMGREPKEKSLVQNIAFYKKLMNFSNDHFLKEGSWRILEVRSAWEGNDSFHNILAWKWSLEEKLKVIIVNYSDVESQARIFWPDVQPQGANLTFLDRYEKNTYERKADEIHKQGLYVSLLPWKFHWFMAEENKKANLQKEKALI